MKLFISPFFCLVAVTVFAEMTEDEKLVFRNGAIGRYIYRVVDNEGFPVSNATAHVWFRSYGRPQDKADWLVLTDTNGMFTAEHRFNEKFSVGIDKEGYYHTHDEINYFTMIKRPVKDGKWQPYGETRTVVLKKIRNPWSVKVFSGDECHHKIPVFGEWLGFDMEKSDWIMPYGSGVHSDVLLRFMKKETDKWYVYSYSLEACFTNNPYAGVYIKQMDDFSALKTDYIADTNANYRVSYVFSKECTEGKPVRISGLGKSQYIVFRTRTRIDEDGDLVGAHYGKFCRGWDSNGREMQIGDGCFNPVENDPNIEGDQHLLYRIQGYKRNE